MQNSLTDGRKPSRGRPLPSAGRTREGLSRNVQVQHVLNASGRRVFHAEKR